MIQTEPGKILPPIKPARDNILKRFWRWFRSIDWGSFGPNRCRQCRVRLVLSRQTFFGTYTKCPRCGAEFYESDY